MRPLELRIITGFCMGSTKDIAESSARSCINYITSPLYGPTAPLIFFYHEGPESWFWQLLSYI